MKVLIVIDLQKDFITGVLGSEAARAIIPNCRAKIIKRISEEWKVFYTFDTPPSNYLDTIEGKILPPHCQLDSEGWELEDTILGIEYEFGSHICKKSFIYNHWERLTRINQEEDPEEIEIIGLCTDICVIGNALMLRSIFDKTKITVDVSCCAALTPEGQEAAIKILKCNFIEVIGE